jgi:hypothetical protein
MGSLNTAPHPIVRSLLKPQQSFLTLGQRQRIFATGKCPGLETAESVNHKGKQRLLCHAVYAKLLNRPILEVDIASIVWATLDVARPTNGIGVVCPTLPRFVRDDNLQLLISWICQMVSQ